jgi:hypothetical protein
VLQSNLTCMFSWENPLLEHFKDDSLGLAGLSRRGTLVSLQSSEPAVLKPGRHEC